MFAAGTAPPASMTETSQQIVSWLGLELQRGLRDCQQCCAGTDAAKGEPVLSRLNLVVGMALAAWFKRARSAGRTASRHRCQLGNSGHV